MMPSIAAMPNSATKPIAAETLNGVPVTNSAKMPPISAIGITLAASSVSLSEPKLRYSSRQISSEAERHHDRQPLQRVLQVAEFADPFEPVAAAAACTCSATLLLRLEHRAAEVAAAHAELDRDVALLLLAIDERRRRKPG